MNTLSLFFCASISTHVYEFLIRDKCLKSLSTFQYTYRVKFHWGAFFVRCFSNIFPPNICMSARLDWDKTRFSGALVFAQSVAQSGSFDVTIFRKDRSWKGPFPARMFCERKRECTLLPCWFLFTVNVFAQVNLWRGVSSWVCHCVFPNVKKNPLRRQSVFRLLCGDFWSVFYRSRELFLIFTILRCVLFNKLLTWAVLASFFVARSGEQANVKKLQLHWATCGVIELKTQRVFAQRLHFRESESR